MVRVTALDIQVSLRSLTAMLKDSMSVKTLYCIIPLLAPLVEVDQVSCQISWGEAVLYQQDDQMIYQCQYQRTREGEARIVRMNWIYIEKVFIFKLDSTKVLFYVTEGHCQYIPNIKTKNCTISTSGRKHKLYLMSCSILIPIRLP